MAPTRRAPFTVLLAVLPSAGAISAAEFLNNRADFPAAARSSGFYATVNQQGRREDFRVADSFTPRFSDAALRLTPWITLAAASAAHALDFGAAFAFQEEGS